MKKYLAFAMALAMVAASFAGCGSSSSAPADTTAATTANLRRFLTGPRECEITGVDSTPDGRTLFVGIQHPGEDASDPNAPTSNWPASQAGAAPGVRPRSAVVAITRADGGIIGL